MERAAGARWPCAGERLPPELQDIVKKKFDASPITLEKARQYQKELMEEHSTRLEEQNETSRWTALTCVNINHDRLARIKSLLHSECPRKNEYVFALWNTSIILYFDHLKKLIIANH